MRKYTFIILTLLLSVKVFSQEHEVKVLFDQGNEAFMNNDFETAKEKYLKVISLDEKHEDAFYNLAMVELKLEDKDAACEHLNKAYQLGISETYNMIMQICSKLQYADKMWRYDVDELPKFKKGEDFLPLFLEDRRGGHRALSIQINPEFIKFLRPALKTDKELKKLKGTVTVAFRITIEGTFEIISMKGEITELQKEKLANVLNNTTELVPAKYDNKAVGMFEALSLPLKF